jgi:hypothetical protein
MSLSPSQLADRAAELLREKLTDEFDIIVHEAVTDAFEEAGIDFDSDEAWDLCMEVCSRIAIVALN